MRELAANGATVHILARNVRKAEDVVQELKSSIGREIDVHIHELNLSSFQSVRHFAAKFLATKTPIHVLINNAGLCKSDSGMQGQPIVHAVLLVNTYKKITVDGNEETCQANHLSHFLLTNLLLDRIIESGPDARIINVSSLLHAYVDKFDVHDINFERQSHLDAFMSKTYNYSKLENVLFTRELARRLHGKGTVQVLH